jgi:hypothetical protein
MHIYDDDRDRRLWLETPGETRERSYIEATKVPEPSSIGVLARGGGLLLRGLMRGNCRRIGLGGKRPGLNRARRNAMLRA